MCWCVRLLVCIIYSYVVNHLILCMDKFLFTLILHPCMVIGTLIRMAAVVAVVALTVEVL